MLNYKNGMQTQTLKYLTVILPVVSDHYRLENAMTKLKIVFQTTEVTIEEVNSHYLEINYVIYVNGFFLLLNKKKKKKDFSSKSEELIWLYSNEPLHK